MSDTAAQAVLFGDYDTPSWYESFTKKRFAYQHFLDESNEIVSLYLHALKTNPGLLRIPSQQCSRDALKQQGIEHQSEPILNLLVSKGKEALEKTGIDALLAGVVGPVHKAKQKTPDLIRSEISETIVYLSDFLVEAYVVQGIADPDEFEITTETIRKITPSPIAPFLPYQPHNSDFFARYAAFAERLQLELLGIEVDIRALPQPQALTFDRGIPFGLLLSCPGVQPAEAELDSLAAEILALSPTVLLGGAGLHKNTWTALRAKIRGEMVSVAQT